MKKFLFAGLLSVSASFAMAQVSVEGAFGSTNLDGSCEGTISCKKNGTGGKLLGSYAFNPNLSVEVGYFSFGEAKYSLVDDGVAWDGKLKSHAIFIGGAARGEFGRGFSGVARLGLAQVTTKSSESSVYISGEISQTGTDPLFGFGIEYTVTQQAQLTAGIDFTQSPIAENNETATLRLISVGLRYSF